MKKRSTTPAVKSSTVDAEKSAAKRRAGGRGSGLRVDIEAIAGSKARPRKEKAGARCVGLDLGDRTSAYCVLSMKEGEVVERGSVSTTTRALQERFAGEPRLRIVIEAGTHSPWVSRLLERLGHEVLVANPSRMVLGGRRRRKTDRIDAEALARIGRLDPALLFPLKHRSADIQADLALLRSRDALVRSRTRLINHCRGQVKAMGARLTKTSAESFPKKTRLEVPDELRPGLEPVYLTIGSLTTQIRDFDRKIERVARERYPEISLLTPIVGVGTITALTYVLTIECPGRFAKSRSVGAYAGLVPHAHQSGDSDPELGITKAGSTFLRRLLCESAQYITGPLGKDCDLRRHGLKIAGAGGKTAKKRAVVAVARKLAVLMHRLWTRGEAYDPLHNARKTEAATATNVAA